MSVKLFVGNLSWDTDSAQLEELFSEYGAIESARVITDRDTGRSRGFGFVEIDTPDAEAVIEALNGREVDGRPIRVNRAEDKPDSRGPRRDRGPSDRRY
jgi:RNA recognition motif-containing protein